MQVVIISGPPNVGKSAAADALCDRYDRMLHIDVGVLRDFLRMGRFPSHDESPEAWEQRALFIGAATDMARRFLGAGYGVVIDDVVTRHDLELYLNGLSARKEPIHFVVLLPHLVDQGEPGASMERARALHKHFAEWPNVARIDPVGLTAELVADRIMALAAAGRALAPLAAT